VAIAKLAEVERSSKSERERMRAEVEQELHVGVELEDFSEKCRKNANSWCMVVVLCSSAC